MIVGTNSLSRSLNVGCGPHHAQGWLNTDLVRTDEIRPDVLVTADRPFPFESASFDRAYVGHVLEHVPWHEVPAWLDDLARVLVPGAPVLFVGPDSDAAIECYRTGTATRAQVDGIIEATSPYHGSELRWDADRHHWNCSGPRMAQALRGAGWLDVTDLEIVAGDLLPALDDWPIVSRAPLQCAVSARSPR